MQKITENDIKLSVVVPLYNEEESVLELHHKLCEALCQLEMPVEILFVDDGSTDRSFEILDEIYEKEPKVRVLQFRRNYGKSAALAVGFRHARGRIIVTIDADLQDDPKEIPKLLKKLEEGYDLVSGWKKDRKDPLVKRVSSRFFNRVTCLLTGLEIHDINCGLKAYRREVTDSIDVYGQLHRFLPVLAHWERFKVGEVVVQHRPRKYGKTKFGLSRFTAGFFDLTTVLFLTKYTKRPLHLFGIVGLLTFSAGFVISAYLSYERLFHQKYLSARPLLFLGVLLIIVGIQFFSIGLLGEMLTASSNQKPEYHIKKELK